MKRTTGLTALLLGALAVPSPAQAADVFLCAGQGQATFGGGTVVPIWSFVERASLADLAPGCGATVAPVGPSIRTSVADAPLTIRLYNDLGTEAVSLVVPGLPAVLSPVREPDGRVRSFTAEVAPGAIGVYTFSSLRPGTYLFHSGTSPQVQVPMGLYGTLVVADSALQPYPGLSVDSELTLIRSEVDPVLSAAIVSDTYGTTTYPANRYSPSHFLINGLEEPPPIAAGNPGGTVLLRLVNAGLEPWPLELLGPQPYLELIAESGNLRPYRSRRHSLVVPPLGTADVTLDQVPAGMVALLDRTRGTLARLQVGLDGWTPPSAGPVVVQPVDPSSGTSPVEIEFASVQQGGVTTVTATATGPPPPSGFLLLGLLGLPYLEIGTTAVVDPPIQVCFDYSLYDISDDSIGDVSIRHLVAPGGAMVNGSVCSDPAGCIEDITDPDLPPGSPNPDTVNDRICGTAMSLSPFFLAQAVQIAAPVNPVAVGVQIQTSLSVSDPSGVDSAQWAWGDGTSSAATITPAGVVEGTHSYTAAGIYTPSLTLLLGGLEVGSAEYRYVVVYDPTAGFVTGGGWIQSPPGAYVPDPALEGRANFGFVSRYRRGQSVPDGQTQFQFRAAGLDFHSTAYDWLVIAGARAQFKGEGEINGEPGYGFLLTAIDGNRPGGGGTDRFRVKIWTIGDGAIVYDNQMGLPDDGDPQTALGGGSIVIHSGN